MPRKSDGIKAKADNFQWYKRDARAVYEGTRCLSLEARGAYTDILDLMYIHNGPLPDDDKWMSHALFVSTRKWRTLKNELTEAGKIECSGGEISNSRARSEIETRANQHRTNSEPASKQRRLKPEDPEKPNEINEGVPRTRARQELEQELEEEIEQPCKHGEGNSILRAEDLRDRLWAATNGCMIDDFQELGVVQKWINAGADPETDILATIKVCAEELNPETIEHYGRFDRAVMDAIEDRKAGRKNRYLPETQDEYFARRLAEEAHHGTA